MITVNSTVDVPKLWLEERHVPVVALKYTIDGETYTDMEGLTAPPKALLLVPGSPLRPKNIPPGCFLYGQTLSGSIPLSAVRNFWSG